MTKAEAEKEMLQGKKVTHTFFLDHEWISMKDEDTIVTDDGFEVPKDEFWKHRVNYDWAYGYSIWKG